ncbi:MAG: WYL domain-containing protein, partial [Actinomycetota bacterium]|nr:WYL domain-containing protein [Actinomycetota bacterium]
TGTARLRVRGGQGHALRRRATDVRADDDGWDLLDVPLADPERLADEVVTFGPAVVALEPRDLRDAVVRRLERLAS